MILLNEFNWVQYDLIVVCKVFLCSLHFSKHYDLLALLHTYKQLPISKP